MKRSNTERSSPIPTFIGQSSTDTSNVTSTLALSTLHTSYSYYRELLAQRTQSNLNQSVLDIIQTSNEYYSPNAKLDIFTEAMMQNINLSSIRIASHSYSSGSANEINKSQVIEIEDKISKWHPYFVLNDAFDAMDEKQFLSENGYVVLSPIQNTLQGELLRAKSIKTGNNVMIKKTDKHLYYKEVTIQNGIHFVVQQDAIKEALILHHLTVDNKAPNGSIVRFIHFLESYDGFYLVIEHAGNVTLAQFIHKAHQLMDEKKLKLKYWRKIVKYLFWQLAVLIHWLHDDIQCCHLDLRTENIMILNGDFMENKADDTWFVDPNIKIKVTDCGLSEVFKAESGFKCSKNGLIDSNYLSAPRVFDGDVYDARKADIWSLGIILFQLFTGLPPYRTRNINETPFQMIKEQKFAELFMFYNKRKYVNMKMLHLISNLLNIRESKRTDSASILKHESLALYYSKYKGEIEKKSKLQIQSNKLLKQKMDLFPYYIL